MTSGIYQIKNNVSGRFYIGRSVNCEKRFSSHRNDLRRKNHCNDRLQKAWDSYGEDKFSFSIIWEEDAENLVELEQFMLDELFDSGELYNLHCSADGGMKGIVYKQEWKDKQAESRKSSDACARHVAFLTSPENHSKAISLAATPEARSKAVATRKANGHVPFEKSRAIQIENARVKLFAALDWAVENSKPRMEAIEKFGSSWGSLKKFLPEWEAINGKLNLPLRASGKRMEK